MLDLCNNQQACWRNRWLLARQTTHPALRAPLQGGELGVQTTLPFHKAQTFPVPHPLLGGVPAKAGGVYSPLKRGVPAQQAVCSPL